jgi:hypothetical protein
MPIRLIRATLRHTNRITHHPHRHIILAHGMEMLGAGLAILKVELLANGLLFGGVGLLLFFVITEEVGQ